MKTIRKTTSICPVCYEKIPANLRSDGEKIYMEKHCREHGEFRDIHWGDAASYHELMKYIDDASNAEISTVPPDRECPSHCGICANHRSDTIVANIDITQACNFQCPVCFADANKDKAKYDPSIEEIDKMMDRLLESNPPCKVLQFAGGEPTVRKDLFEIARMARQKGFVHLQVATNGKILAEDPDFAEKLVQADFDTIYMQFDGTTPEPYIKLRGFDALPLKIQAIENVRKHGTRPNIVLVPTVVKGVNDHLLGDILRFALDNMDLVRGINMQPISFTGRISNQDLLNQRITTPDIIFDICRQTEHDIDFSDFLTFSDLNTVPKFLNGIDPASYPHLDVHPLCGMWTFLFNNGKTVLPLTKLINLRELFRQLPTHDSISKSDILWKLILKLPKIIHPERVNKSLKFLDLIKGALIDHTKESARSAIDNRNLLFIGIGHFMDPYNFDFERLERCAIHYAVPDGRILPLCSYNNFFRDQIYG